MRTFRPAKNEIKITIDFKYEYALMWLKCVDFQKSTHPIWCKGDALDLRHTFEIIYQHVNHLTKNRPDLIADNLISKNMLEDFILTSWMIKFEGIMNDIPVNLTFTDMEKFLVYLAENKLLTDYNATNLFAVYYPTNNFNYGLLQDGKVMSNKAR